MHSITYGIGYFLAILAVDVFSSEYHFLSETNITLSYRPFNFCYKKSHDFLIMAIILRNISPSVTAVHLKYTYEQYDSQYLYWHPSEQRVVKVEKPTNEVKFMILKHLTHSHIVVEVELYSQQKICGTTNIAGGRDETTLTPLLGNENIFVHDYQYNKLYYKTAYCLAPNPCEIVVDLKNNCQEQTLPRDVSCNIEKSQYICTFTKQQNTMTFSQTYEDGSYIGPALQMNERTTSKLFIKLELFDNNTLVKITTTKNETIWPTKLSFTAEDINSEDYDGVTKRRYSETTDVEYSCQKPKKYVTKYIVHIGLINTTDNKITTHNTALIQRKFKMADNGTILCCLYYLFRTDWTNGKQVYIITRDVKNKSLLFYDSQESISNNFTESKEQTKSPVANWLIYLVPTFLGMSVLMLAIYVIKKKHCCTNSQPVEEMVELDNNATQNQVLYANLDFVTDGNQPESQNVESHYANVIGSLHPL